MSGTAAPFKTHGKPEGAGVPYSRISQNLRRQIEAGDLKPGERLPTIREMARACGVSPFTVGRALSELARDGLVIARTGSGTYVAETQEATVEVVISYPASAWPEAPAETLYFGQILRGIETAASPAPRCFTSFMDEEHARAEEILAVCRARRAKRLLVYRPRGRMARELAAVVEHIPTVTLIAPLPGTPSGCATIDPYDAFRRLLLERIAAGRREFYYAAVVTDIADEFSPYARMYQCFLRVMAEAGIRPMIFPVNRFAAEGVQQLSAMAPEVPDGVVFIASYPGLFDAVKMNRPQVDLISYTERGETLDRLKGRVTLLHGGMDRCAAAAMELFRRPFNAEGAPRPVVARVAPDVFPAGTCPAASPVSKGEGR